MVHYRITQAQKAHLDGKPAVLLQVEFTGELGTTPVTFTFHHEGSGAAYRQIEVKRLELELAEREASLQDKERELAQRPDPIEAAQNELLDWAQGHVDDGTVFPITNTPSAGGAEGGGL